MNNGSSSNKRAEIFELLIVVILSAVFVLSITIGFGTMSSGWHLVDDHQFFRYLADFKYNGKSLLDVIKSELIRDITTQHRARLLYYTTRVPQAYLFGYNSIPYYVIKSVEAIIAMIYLYYVGRELGLGIYISGLFSIIVLTGLQSPVWWKLGPQNLQAQMFLAIGFYYMIDHLKTRRKVSQVVSLVAFTIMANFHESFIVILPFIAVFIIFYELKTSYKGEKLSIKLLFEIIKKNIVSIGVLFIVCVSLVLFIFLVVDVHGYGFVQENYSLKQVFINMFESLVVGDLKYYWWFGTLLLIILASFYNGIRPLWPAIVVSLSFFTPELYLYKSEGFYERYLLPMTFGWGLMFICGAYGMKIITGFRKIIYTSLLSIMVLFLVRSAIVEADYYRFRGESVTAMLEETLALSEEGYNVVSSLGTCNPEADMTVSEWMLSHCDDDVWYWHESVKEIMDVCPYISNQGEKLQFSDVDLFIAYNTNDRHYTMNPTVDLSGFHLVKCGSLNLYFSDRVYETLSEEDLERFSIKPTIYGIGA